MPPNPDHNFGFDILTERKKLANNDDVLYEAGESTNQYVAPYTDDAVVLQSILEYSIEFGTENYFKSRQISENHLIKKCDYYIELYKGFEVHTKKKARAEKMNPRVTESLEKLTWLELIDAKPSIAKNGEPTQKYRFTKLGRMMGLLLLFENDGRKLGASQFEEIYKQIHDFYQSMKHSHAKLCLIFFEVCYSRVKFHQITYSLAELLKNSSDDKHLFLRQLRFLDLVYRDDEMWDIFKISLSTLRQKNITAYHIILFNYKLDIEEIHEFKVRHLKEFENSRLENIQEIGKVVVYGYCHNCKNFIIATMRTLDYLESYVMSAVSEEHVSDIECTSCHKDYLDFQSVM